jgi:hypothetical protein
MSVFYVLPPRPLLAEHLVAFLRPLFPGLDWAPHTRLNLTEALSAAATCHPDVYVVFREELPAGETTRQALLDGFGAEEGDEVVEVRAGSRPGELLTRRWQMRVAA